MQNYTKIIIFTFRAKKSEKDVFFLKNRVNLQPLFERVCLKSGKTNFHHQYINKFNHEQREFHFQRTRQ